MFKLVDQNNDTIHQSQSRPEWIQGVWECGDARFTDQNGDLYVVLEISIPPTVGAIAFIRLFTLDERVKARELRTTDPKINDFWAQLDDPRVTEVVMALPSIQSEVEYTLSAINAAGVALDVQARKAEILSGQPF